MSDHFPELFDPVVAPYPKPAPAFDPEYLRERVSKASKLLDAILADVTAAALELPDPPAGWRWALARECDPLQVDVVGDALIATDVTRYVWRLKPNGSTRP